MLPKITMTIDPHELYDETDLLMGLKAVQGAVSAIQTGLSQCVVRNEEGKVTAEIEGMLQKIARSLDAVGRQIIGGTLTVQRTSQGGTDGKADISG